MVRAAPKSEIENPAVAVPTQKIGKAHAGFSVALLVAGPLLMVASMGFVGLLMGAAMGHTGTAWLVGSGMFGTMALVFTGSLILAEGSKD